MKFERMARKAMDVCLRVLFNERNKSRFDSYSVTNSVLIISHITFRDCCVQNFSDNLSRNSCKRGLTVVRNNNILRLRLRYYEPFRLFLSATLNPSCLLTAEEPKKDSQTLQISISRPSYLVLNMTQGLVQSSNFTCAVYLILISKIYCYRLPYLFD